MRNFVSWFCHLCYKMSGIRFKVIVCNVCHKLSKKPRVRYTEINKHFGYVLWAMPYDPASHVMDDYVFWMEYNKNFTSVLHWYLRLIL